MFSDDPNLLAGRHIENLVIEKSSKRIRGILKHTLSDPIPPKEITQASEEDVENSGTGDEEKKKSGDDVVESTGGNSDCTRHVMFADDCKCDLIEVRNFLSRFEDTELWSGCKYFQGIDDRKTRDCSLSKEGFEREPELVLCFSDPCTEPDFMDELKTRHVIVERCRVRDRHILGIILVQNIESNEYVFVRSTTDKWASYTDVAAKIVPNFSDDDVSHFAFELELPKDTLEMEFEVCYKLSSSEYWDNNRGEKYKVQDIHHAMALEGPN